MARQRSVFDIVGPIMIGPSSSHTAGAVRLGALARAVFGEQPTKARIGLHGSFDSTGRGHGTDLALVAGLLGWPPDDGRIPDSFEEARRAGLDFEFASVDLGEVHPNTALFELHGAQGRTMRIQGASLGGGAVVVTDIDGFGVEISGELPVLVVEHYDQPGEIASISGILAKSGINIARMQVSRERRGARALMLIETDSPADEPTCDLMRAQPGIIDVQSVATV